jgi:predicted DNA repair protein MutK
MNILFISIAIVILVIQYFIIKKIVKKARTGAKLNKFENIVCKYHHWWITKGLFILLLTIGILMCFAIFYVASHFIVKYW